MTEDADPGEAHAATLRGGGRSRRAVAAFVDEAVSSIQNYVVLFAALHALSLADVGRFTLAYTSVTLAEIVLKALVLTTLNIDFAAADASSQRRAAADAAAAGVLAGGGVLAIAALVSAALPGERDLMLATGVAALCLLAQESWRTYFFTAARPWHAVANDSACLAATVGLVWLASRANAADTPADLLYLLAAGTGVGFAVGIAQTRLIPSVRGGLRWLRRCWPVGIRVAGSRGAAQLAGRLSLAVVGAEAGAAALGRLGAARTLVAPATTLVTAMAAYSLPEAVRLHRRGDPRLRRFLLGNSAGLTVLVLLTGLVLAVLPDGLGRALGGKNFAAAKELLLPVVLYAAGNALQQGARVGILALVRPGVALRIALSTGAGIVLAAAVGAWLGGVSGAAWGLAVVQGIQIGTWWLAFARVAADRPSRRVCFGPRRPV